MMKFVMVEGESQVFSENINTREGYQTLDLIKLLMAFLILVRHIFQAYVKIDSVAYFVVADSISTIGVPTFFVISGFLFFHKKSNLKKQCLRLMRLYIVYSIIYLPFSIKNLMNDGYKSWHMVLRYMQEAFFKGSYYHLWYVPALIIGLLICVLLDKKDGVKVDIIVGFLFLIGLIGRDYYSLIPGCDFLVETYNKVFLTFCNGVFWGCPMVWMGRKLCSLLYHPLKPFKKAIIMTIIAALFMLLFIESYLVRNITLDQINSNLLCSDIIAVLIVAVGISSNIQIFCKKNPKKIRILGTCLYFIHPLMLWVIPFFSKRIVLMNKVNEIIAVCLTSVIVSFLISMLSTKVKALKILY